MCERKAYPHIVYLDKNRIQLRVNLVYCFVLLDDSLQPRGKSITKLKGGGEGGRLEGLSQKPQNIYPEIAKKGDLPVSLSL